MLNPQQTKAEMKEEYRNKIVKKIIHSLETETDKWKFNHDWRNVMEEYCSPTDPEADEGHPLSNFQIDTVGRIIAPVRVIVQGPEHKRILKKIKEIEERSENEVIQHYL